MYTITSDIDVRDMARGAVLLGSGGGGDPYVGELYLRNQLAEGRSPQIMKASELRDDAFVGAIAGVGAPTVIIVHLVSTHTLLRLLEASESFYGRKIDALISAEIGICAPSRATQCPGDSQRSRHGRPSPKASAAPQLPLASQPAMPSRCPSPNRWTPSSTTTRTPKRPSASSWPVPAATNSPQVFFTRASNQDLLRLS